jgi:hypothetical protein
MPPKVQPSNGDTDKPRRPASQPTLDDKGRPIITNPLFEKIPDRKK